MKRIFTLTLLALLAIGGAKATTYYVYFKNSSNWSTVNCYYWGGKSSVSWPGTAMTQVGDTYVFSFTDTGTPTNVIFNNGSSQTSDLTFTNGATYNGSGSTLYTTSSWTIVGTNTILNGSSDSWTVTETANDMTKGTDGYTYTLTVTDKTLEKGITYEYKAAMNHAWDVSFPAGNNSITVDETAVYTIVYTLNAATGAVSAELTKTGEAAGISHTYTVAGAEEICGTSWSVSADAGNDMVKNEETQLYEWTSATVTLAASTTYGLKVALDHSWGVSYGDTSTEDGNYHVTTDKAGRYTLYVSFDTTTHAISHTLTYLGADVDYYISGEPTSFFGAYWDSSKSDDYKFQYDSEKGLYYWTHTGLVADTSLVDNTGIRLKAYDSNGNWYGSQNYIINKDNGLYAHGDYTVTIYFDPNGTETGSQEEGTFQQTIYSHSSEQINIVATMSKNYAYATLYYGDYNLEVPEGVTANAAHYTSGDKIDFTATWKEGEVIPKGTPVVLHGEEAEKEYTFNVEPDDDVTSKGSYENDLLGTDEGGTFEAADGYYMYGLNYIYAEDGETKIAGFYWQKGTGGSKVTMKAHKAYLTLTKDAITSTRGAIFFGNGESGEGETTGVSQVTGHGSQVTNIFDLQGRKLSKVQRGVNIVGGKKVLVR